MTSEPSLEDRLEVLLASTEGIREQIQIENRESESRFRANEKRMRTNRIATRVAIAVGVFGVAVGGFGIRAIQDANRDRKQRSVASCLQYNRQQVDQIEKDKALSHDFVAAISTGGGKRVLTPEQQKTVDAFNAKHDRLIEEKNALRDCSPAGIERYLSTPTTKGTS